MRLLNSESAWNQRESIGTEVINSHSLILAARADGRWPFFRRRSHHAFERLVAECAFLLDELDVAHHGQQIALGINQRRLRPSLPKGSAARVAIVERLNVVLADGVHGMGQGTGSRPGLRCAASPAT
ncbi:MAG: hypothetical protein ABIU96_10760, partial [Rhodanobacter sp.]